MHDIGYNLGLAEAMLKDAEAYLLSPELLWTLSHPAGIGAPPFPQFTPGNLLLTLDELACLEPGMEIVEKARLEEVRLGYSRLLLKWPVAFERKAEAELRMRMRLWQAYLADLDEDHPDTEAYPADVRHRVICSRLVGVAGSSPETRDRLNTMDTQLLSIFEKGKFVWDRRLRSIYPPDAFWFLYGSPRVDQERRSAQRH